MSQREEIIFFLRKSRFFSSIMRASPALKKNTMIQVKIPLPIRSWVSCVRFPCKSTKSKIVKTRVTKKGRGNLSCTSSNSCFIFSRRKKENIFFIQRYKKIKGTPFSIAFLSVCLEFFYNNTSILHFFPFSHPFLGFILMISCIGIPDTYMTWFFDISFPSKQDKSMFSS